MQAGLAHRRLDSHLKAVAEASISFHRAKGCNAPIIGREQQLGAGQGAGVCSRQGAWILCLSDLRPTLIQSQLLLRHYLAAAPADRPQLTS